MILHGLARFGHTVGLMLISAGLIGVFIADIRSRQARSLEIFAEAVRSIALFYDGLVVPGAVLLAASGLWLIAGWHGWGAVVDQPWLLGMIGLFLFEFVEGNTVTRLYFLRLRRETARALAAGGPTPTLTQAAGGGLATFTHFLDLPLLLVIVMLGVLRPDDWFAFVIGCAAAVATATALTCALPRLCGRPLGVRP